MPDGVDLHKMLGLADPVDDAIGPAPGRVIAVERLCATARNVLGSPAEKLAALALPSAAAAIRWNPLLQQVSAEILGLALLGPVDDPATSIRARAQLRRTPTTQYASPSPRSSPRYSSKHGGP